MWKLRHGRWRAAVYEDPSGQAWLCAAGIRAKGDLKDFYTSFPDAVARRGPDAFLPTADDFKRLRLEEAEEHLSRWETAVHERTRDAFVGAAETGAHHYEIPGVLPGDAALCHVRVEVETIAYDDDPPDELSTVAVTVKRSDWSRTDLADRADIVILAAIQPHEQAWDITTLPDGALFSFDCSPEELAGLVEDETQRQPGTTTPGRLRHWTHRQRLTQSIVEGLCGVWFVPRQDAEKLETCPHCAAVHRRLGD
jgi:hypothetical protein